MENLTIPHLFKYQSLRSLDIEKLVFNMVYSCSRTAIRVAHNFMHTDTDRSVSQDVF